MLFNSYSAFRLPAFDKLEYTLCKSDVNFGNFEYSNSLR